MAVVEGARESVRGALIADERRQPAGDGALVDLHAPALDASLERVARAGGGVVLSKTDIGRVIAPVRDTEGNVVGLHARR
jgi:predicted enzyme related to lactoylglutathione lyase